MNRRWCVAGLMLAAIVATLVGCSGGGSGVPANPGIESTADLSTAVVSAAATSPVYMGNMVVFGFNELGMHCMNQDFSKEMVLPPFNTLRALVIRRGEEPRIVKSGVTVSYSIPGNTRSTTKTNFWTYASKLLGMAVAPDAGLTGTRMAGNMAITSSGRWEATGIPITPVTDNGTLNPYQLASIVVKASGKTQASTQAVVPVSWEIRCDLCHKGPEGTDMALLKSHDRLHGTKLASSTPVACGSCHLQAPLAGVLGNGKPGVKSLSAAMHGAHASRMAASGQTNQCYACHPGPQTQCLRDVHKAKGMNCVSCHGSMATVAQTSRRPWVDEPKCSNCHHVSGHQYEEAGKLFKESRGHHGVYCTACHGAPHAVGPSTVAADNAQAIGLQGKAGTINTCSVCHRNKPGERFTHSLSGDD